MVSFRKLEPSNTNWVESGLLVLLSAEPDDLNSRLPFVYFDNWQP
jgi:hypothetical protein